MRRLLLIALALALLPSAAQAAQPTVAPLALYGHSGQETYLSRLDPVTLAPTEPNVRIPEAHGAYSFAPDGSQIAFSVSTIGEPGTPGTGRVGLRTYDTNTLGLVREFRTGSAMGAVGWLAPRRILAMGQTGGGVLLADPFDGSLRSRSGTEGAPCIDPPGRAVTRRALVVLMGSTLNTIDRDGAVRSVTLRGFSNVCRRLGITVDRTRELAYVIGVGREAATVNLRTMRVAYTRLPATRASRVAYTHAHGIGFGRYVAAHENSRTLPKGVELINLIARERRMIDARAGGARVARGRILAYDGRAVGAGSKGLRVYDHTGRHRWTVLDREVVRRLEVLGDFAYAQTDGGLRVIDIAERKVVSRSPFDVNLEVDFVLPERAGVTR